MKRFFVEFAALLGIATSLASFTYVLYHGSIFGSMASEFESIVSPVAPDEDFESIRKRVEDKAEKSAIKEIHEESVLSLLRAQMKASHDYQETLVSTTKAAKFSLGIQAIFSGLAFVLFAAILIGLRRRKEQ